MRKYPRIIYFIDGPVPSDAEYEAAEKLGFNVVFRNALLIGSEGALEACDGVAGSVPARYEHIPEAVEVLAEFEASFKRNGENKAPLSPPAGSETKGKGEAKEKEVKAAPAGKTEAEKAAAPAPNPGAAGAWKPNL